MQSKVAIIGAGYIGLPLALRFAQQGTITVTVDVDPGKVEAINAGNSYINEIPAADIAAAVEQKHLRATTEFDIVAKANAIIVCVPTPLTPNREPDLHYVLQTAESISPHLQPGQLVSLESTTYPGTTSGCFRETLEKQTKLQAGKDFHLAFSPEREDPGNPNSRVDRVPKIVGGLTENCQQAAATLYGTVAGSVVKVGSCEVAEAAKLLENIFLLIDLFFRSF